MTRGQVGPRGAMLVGVDLKKDANRLHAAYNDARGVTARFNLNLLARINRELGGDFRLRNFRHYAFLQRRLWPHRDAPRVARAADRQHRRLPLRLRNGRIHPYRKLVQVFGRGFPRARPARRLQGRKGLASTGRGCSPCTA